MFINYCLTQTNVIKHIFAQLVLVQDLGLISFIGLVSEKDGVVCRPFFMLKSVSK